MFFHRIERFKDQLELIVATGAGFEALARGEHSVPGCSNARILRRLAEK
jgi:hypothetical protein